MFRMIAYRLNYSVRFCTPTMLRFTSVFFFFFFINDALIIHLLGDTFKTIIEELIKFDIGFFLLPIFIGTCWKSKQFWLSENRVNFCCATMYFTALCFTRLKLYPSTRLANMIIVYWRQVHGGLIYVNLYVHKWCVRFWEQNQNH